MTGNEAQYASVTLLRVPWPWAILKGLSRNALRSALLPNYKAYEAGRFVLSMLEYTFKAYCVH